MDKKELTTVERIQRIANTNGYQVVREKAKEELIELEHAIETNIEQDILDEIVDVQIMIHQLMHIYGFKRTDVLDHLKFKVERTEQRLGIGRKKSVSH